MKNTFLLAASLVFFIPAKAQVRQRVSLESATVFLSGAELFSTAKLSLPAGETEIILTNVASNVNAQTLTLNATNDVVVQSAVFQNYYLNPADSQLSPRARTLRDSLDGINNRFVELGIRKDVVDEQLSTIRSNKELKGENTGLNVTDLQKMLDLMNSRMQSLLTEQTVLDKKKKELQARHEQLNNQYQEEQRKGFQPGGQLLVKFYTPRATSTDLSMTYVVSNAGWSPAYDLRVESVSKPVKLYYKAQVMQNSGIAWKGIKLTLSSGNPGEGAEAPQLAPWYLAYYKPEYVQNQSLQRSNVEKMAVRDVAGQVATTAGVLQSGRGSTLNISGGRGENTVYSVDGVLQNTGDIQNNNLQQSSMNRYTSVDAAGIVTNFDIEIPYDIPSDGKAHNIGIKTYELPASYRYVAVPKLDKDAFLQAQVTKWEELNLLPAPSSVFFEGSYVGQGVIDPRNVGDTMNFSLGRDKRIVIRRERDRLYRSDRTIGSNIHEAFTYITTLRNTKKEVVSIFITDQFPVSNDNDIIIEDKEVEDARLEENTGLAYWEIKLKPGETKKLRLAYTVKHPKGRVLSNSGK